jgi:hypothetical protein
MFSIVITFIAAATALFRAGIGLPGVQVDSISVQLGLELPSSIISRYEDCIPSSLIGLQRALVFSTHALPETTSRSCNPSMPSPQEYHYIIRGQL